LVEIIRVLYDDVLAFRPTEPTWPLRDRLILSKGHGCMALYALLGDKGFFSKQEYGRFCKSDGILGGHPERAKVPGVEASTGSLGHGLAIGVGMALAGRHDGQNHRVMVIVGDGECDEGSIWEAAMAAAKHRLGNLTVIVDYNKMQSYSSTTEVLDLEPFADKWRAFGFKVAEVNGHDVAELRNTLCVDGSLVGTPRAVICHTVKGRGVRFMESNLKWHHVNKLAPDDEPRILAELGLPRVAEEF
jgi:transketolase